MANWPFFTETELACRCCGRADMDAVFMRRLIGLREELGFPFILSSAFRCPERNRQVSDTGLDGPHTTGQAVDVKVWGSRALDIVSKAKVFGFTGVGVAQKGERGARYCHLDDLRPPNYPRPTLWSY